MNELVARLLFPASLVVAAAVWAKGYADVGDGFSAGAIAGLGAVLQYFCLGHHRAAALVGAGRARHLLISGLLLSLAVLLGPAILGAAPVTHFPAPSGSVPRLGVVELHSAAAFDLGVAVLVYGALVSTFDRLFPVLEEVEE